MDIVLLAMTKMSNGICIAGIDPKDGQWVRPMWEYGQWPARIDYLDKQPMRIGDVIRLSSPRHRRKPPHIEDVIVRSFRLTDRLSENELGRFLSEHAVDNDTLDKTLAGDDRSLCLIEAEDFRTVHVKSGDLMTTRLYFSHGGYTYTNETQSPGYPCTDLRWRAYRRQYQQDPRNIRAFLGVGLTREWQGRCHPMVISVICSPDFPYHLDSTVL